MLVTSIFFFFPTMFSIQLKTKVIILSTFILSSANAFNLDQSKSFLFYKEFKKLLYYRVGGLALTDKTEVMDNGVIMFKEATQTEQGSYICTATNDMGTITATVTLIVQGPPTITLQPSQTVYALIGERVTLECTAQGEPTPQVYWVEPETVRRGDLPPDVEPYYPTSDGSAILDIASVSRGDQGNYRCVASNTGGTAEETVQLIGKLYCL